MLRTLCCSLWVASLFAADDAIVVEVNGDAIRASEVSRAFNAATKGQKLTVAAENALQRGLVARLVDERLVLANLKRQGRAVKPAEVDLALQRLEARLTPGGFATLLKDRQMTRDDLVSEYSRRMTWQRYLDEKTTDENLQKFFEKYRREFDGTELRVAHILWKLPEDCPPEKLAAAKQAAAEVRAEILAKKLSFADAAKKHSQAPTAVDGGGIGWIRRRDPMPESFSRAAFMLTPDEVSEPIVSPVGVHLIHCLEVKAGTKARQDVVGELKPAMAEYLFAALARQERERTPPPMIRYVDPAFRPQEAP